MMTIRQTTLTMICVGSWALALGDLLGPCTLTDGVSSFDSDVAGFGGMLKSSVFIAPAPHASAGLTR